MAESNSSTSKIGYSPFLNPGPVAASGDLALLALSRQSTVPVSLGRPSTSSHLDDEIANTRFGSFPHSTLLDAPWGTQISASNVNKGHPTRGKKRKHTDASTKDDEDDNESQSKGGFEAAASGFGHVLYPTPEAWTLSLPHRTQVVYAPDYSYILQRLQARPGHRIIEAGAGSGSFTHAAARAVFNGFPRISEDEPRTKRVKYGQVFSFEYHEPRHRALRKEIDEHGLDSIVTLTHRDVYEDGFCVVPPPFLDSTSTQAAAIFLDLPAPWTALKHLTRTEPSPLDPLKTVRICTFSPCIEQVLKTIDALREHGWVDIDMVEILHRRIDVRRERVGLSEDGVRGGNSSPATVGEAVTRLRELEVRQSEYHSKQRDAIASHQDSIVTPAGDADRVGESISARPHPHPKKQPKPPRLPISSASLQGRKLWKEGRLVHKTEPDIKTHTSYLLFAVLPRAWTVQDEAQCVEKWPLVKSLRENGVGGGKDEMGVGLQVGKNEMDVSV